MNLVSCAVRAVIVACVVGTAFVAPVAYERQLDAGSINQAIAIGVSRSAGDRARFHRPYRIDVNRTPIDWIDVITPFRRVVLGAEAHTRDGGRLYGQRDALALLGGSPDQVDVVVELTFHPLNTYVGIPEYLVTLVRGDERLEPALVDRVPRFGPRLTGTPLPYPFSGGGRVPLGTEPLLGGILAAHFDGRTIAADGAYDVLVGDSGGMEVGRARVTFGALR